jgi:hypothetical protein
MSSKPELRIGHRVVCTKGDGFISEGAQGLIVNVVPPRFNRPGRARVLWDDQCVSLIDATDFEVLPRAEQAS